MSSKQTTPCAIVVDLHAQACEELFEAYGLAQHLNRGEAGLTVVNGATYASVLSATGDGIRLSSTVSMDARLLARTHPSRQAHVPVREVQDWCREINNQLVGRVKNKLLRLGCEVVTGLPVLITGTDVAAVAMPDIDHRQYFLHVEVRHHDVHAGDAVGPGSRLDATQVADADEIRVEGAMALF